MSLPYPSENIQHFLTIARNKFFEERRENVRKNHPEMNEEDIRDELAKLWLSVPDMLELLEREMEQSETSFGQ